jgi:catechol 2,3-dioxygenase-like lactoylglutathione lyase family enzyme
MAKINKVGHVVLNVSDLDTSIAFYTAALGMYYRGQGEQ